jgi:hypothetical protein
MEEINGKVRLPDGYFLKMAKADYRDYRSALWREIYQNSIDAAASEIIVTWDTDSRTITINDDGCGMDLDTLQNKLLVLGGSKKAEGATGAFGKAKELELFSWEMYELHTHNLLLTGSGNEYTITETPVYRDGCSIELIIQEEEDFQYITGFAGAVAKKMETDCIIYVDGLIAQCTAPKGKLIKTLDCGEIYVNESLEGTNYAKVRMNGIWMFDQYAGNGTPHITLELSGNSVASLNSNRDGMKNSCLEEANKFFNRLASDRQSALFPDKEQIRLHAQGTEGRQIEITEDDIQFLEARYRDMPKTEFMKAVAEFVVENAEMADTVLAKMRVIDVDRFDYDRLKFFGFKWDTIHKYEKGQEKDARSFLDGSQAKARRANTLLTMWGETIKQVMLDTGDYHKFTIGLNWDKNQQAQLESKDGKLTFYVNPNILAKYPLNNKKGLARKLKMSACHEVAHLNDEYHDEYFVMGMERTVEATWKSEKIYARIAKTK